MNVSKTLLTVKAVILKIFILPSSVLSQKWEDFLDFQEIRLEVTNTQEMKENWLIYT